MSEYGPAIFCRRADGEALSESEQEQLLELVAAACETLNVIDDWEGLAAEPWKYDYDGYEPNAVSFVLWSNYAFGQAPDYIQDDFHQNAKDLSKKLGKELAKSHPGVYDLDGYYVEV